MPLDRAWYNTLVDDAGDGLSGSVWDKDDISKVFDEVDKTLTYGSFTNGGQSIPNGTPTPVQWQVEVFDPFNLHPNVNGTGIIPAAAIHNGLYLLLATVTWTGATGGYRSISWRLNGTTPIGIASFLPAGVAGLGLSHQSIQIAQLTNGTQYAELMAEQNSGAALAIYQAALQVHRIA
jgi:hypothetical protein